MANHSRTFDLRTREARQVAYLATPRLAELHPRTEEISAELSFKLADGKKTPPHRRLFMPDMQAYFDMQCPDRNCSNGGFDLTAAVAKAVRDKTHETAGVLLCAGSRERETCGIQLDYQITAQLRDD